MNYYKLKKGSTIHIGGIPVEVLEDVVVRTATELKSDEATTLEADEEQS